VVIVMPTLEGISLSGGSKGRVHGLTDANLGIELSGGAGLTATGTAGIVGLDGSPARSRRSAGWPRARSRWTCPAGRSPT
jgi:hypothetical protein